MTERQVANAYTKLETAAHARNSAAFGPIVGVVVLVRRSGQRQLAEQERRMNSLRRQVAKARRYQALAADGEGVLGARDRQDRPLVVGCHTGSRSKKAATASCTAAPPDRPSQWALIVPVSA